MRESLRSEGLRLLREAFVGNLSPMELAKRDACDAELGLGMVRKANRDYLQQVDHLLQESIGHGLVFFNPVRRLVPLAPGERRYREATREVGGVQLRRCARQLVGGERIYEVPREYHPDGGEKVPVLHVAIDQGQHGLASWWWLLVAKGLRMSLSFDIFHRVHNDLLAATSSSGLASVRLNACHLLRYKEGPFKSESNSSVLRGAAQDLHASAHWSNPLWELLYAAVAFERGMSTQDAEFASEDHMERLWTEVLSVASTRGTGEQTRPSRWFAFERASRRVVGSRHLDLLLLLWLGCRRSWWNGIDKNPLLSLWTPEAVAEPVGDVVPAECVEAVVGEAEDDNKVDASEFANISMNQG